MLCQYQVLYHDDATGYVLRCEGCESIQFCYGNLMVTFAEPDFISFHQWLGKIKEEPTPVQGETVRCIIIPTPCDGMKLVVSAREVKELHQMLEKADAEMQALRLIGLFSEAQN